MSVTTCPHCRSTRVVSEQAILDQMDEDDAYQCPACRKHYDPFAPEPERGADASDASDSVADLIGKDRRR